MKEVATRSSWVLQEAEVESVLRMFERTRIEKEWRMIERIEKRMRMRMRRRMIERREKEWIGR